MLLVVIGHCASLWTTEGWFNQPPVQESMILGNLSSWIGSFHIYAFVLVSGYIFASLRYEQGKYRNFWVFVISKVKRLLIPYVFAAVVWAAPWHSLFFHASMDELIRKYVLAVSPSQLWFLWMLFVVFLMAFFLSDKMYSRPVLGLGISLALYAVCYVGEYFIPNIFQIWSAGRYLLLFFLGMLLRKDKRNRIYRIPCLGWVIMDIVLFILTKYCAARDGLVFQLLHVGLPILLHVTGAVMAFVLLNVFADKISKFGYESHCFYRFFERNNFTIYLFHQQVIYIVITWLNGKVSSFILALCNFIIAICLSSLIAVILNRWKLTRFLVGQKVFRKME